MGAHRGNGVGAELQAQRRLPRSSLQTRSGSSLVGVAGDEEPMRMRTPTAGPQLCSESASESYPVSEIVPSGAAI
jgi:hypothetical protein